MVIDEKIQDNPVLHNGDALPSEIKTTAFHQKTFSKKTVYKRNRSPKKIIQERGLQKRHFNNWRTLSQDMILDLSHLAG